jgi:arginine metabolism regulation protein II
MSDSMASAFQIGSIDASLLELDNRSKSTSGQAGEDLAVGPFGVLKFGKPRTTPEAAQDAEGDVAVKTSPTLDTPLTIDPLVGLDDSLQWADLFGFASNAFVDNDVLDSMLEFSTQDTTPCLPLSHDPAMGLGHRLTPTDSSFLNEKEVLAEGQCLLRHFNSHVFRRGSCLPITSKSPWGVVLLTEAIHTLAQLTFMGASVTSAKKANLFGLLAISSYHLFRNPSFEWQQDRQSGYWLEFSRWTTFEGRRNLQYSLKHEISGPAKAKYKDQMSAILSLLTVAVGIASHLLCSPTNFVGHFRCSSRCTVLPR